MADCNKKNETDTLYKLYTTEGEQSRARTEKDLKKEDVSKEEGLKLIREALNEHTCGKNGSGSCRDNTENNEEDSKEI